MRLLLPIAATVAAISLSVTGIHHHAPIARADAACAGDGADNPMDGEEEAAIDLINGYRAQSGLAPLVVSRSLTRAARWKATDLASGSPFGHDDSFRSWSQRIRDCGYGSSWASENIAAGFADAAGTVRQWMDSAPHRANILSGDMRAVGIARHQGGVYGWYWTVDFGNLTDDAIAGTDIGSD
jgi:uncharacterized protein YkwD